MDWLDKWLDVCDYILYVGCRVMWCDVKDKGVVWLFGFRYYKTIDWIKFWFWINNYWIWFQRTTVIYVLCKVFHKNQQKHSFIFVYCKLPHITMPNRRKKTFPRKPNKWWSFPFTFMRIENIKWDLSFLFREISLFQFKTFIRCAFSQPNPITIPLKPYKSPTIFQQQKNRKYGEKENPKMSSLMDPSF